jgi:hypothetical protein
MNFPHPFQFKLMLRSLVTVIFEMISECHQNGHYCLGVVPKNLYGGLLTHRRV